MTRFLVWFAYCTALFALGYGVGEYFFKDDSPSHTFPHVQISYPHKHVVEIETGACWIVLNTRNKTSYVNCTEKTR